MFSARSTLLVGAVAAISALPAVFAADQRSMSRVININSVTDFCLYAPPDGGEVAQFEAEEVAYCLRDGYGTRVMPSGTIQSAHFVKTQSYVQVTGTGDFTKIGITAGDQGGELDPHGATGEGNPVGGIIYSNGQVMPEWFMFMSANDYCFRACYPGARATSLCRHEYDVLGCGFNAPGNYAPNVFETCDGQDAQDIMYGYPGLSTFRQDDTLAGVPVPSPHPAPASYNCQFTNSAALGGVATPGGSPASTTSSSSTSSSSSTTASSTSTTSSSTSSSSTSSETSMSTSTTTAAPTSSTTVNLVVVTASVPSRTNNPNAAVSSSVPNMLPALAALSAVLLGAAALL